MAVLRDRIGPALWGDGFPKMNLREIGFGRRRQHALGKLVEHTLEVGRGLGIGVLSQRGEAFTEWNAARSANRPAEPRPVIRQEFVSNHPEGCGDFVREFLRRSDQLIVLFVCCGWRHRCRGCLA